MNQLQLRDDKQRDFMCLDFTTPSFWSCAVDIQRQGIFVGLSVGKGDTSSVAQDV